MDKWFTIFVIGFAAAMMAPAAIQEYVEGQCRVAAIQHNVPASEIKMACGLKN